MPSQSYALEPNGPKRLEISWGAFWKDFTLQLDGQQLGTVANSAELRQGREFTLPDGSTLRVQLKRGLTSELHLHLNGKALPGTAGDPLQRLRLAAYVLFFIGGLNAIFGLFGLLVPIDFFQQIGVGLFNLLLGLVFLLLAVFVLRRSLVALGIAFALLLVETISRLLSGFSPALFLNLVFLVILWQGMDALRDLGWRGPIR